jgi:hypothetical protein
MVSHFFFNEQKNSVTELNKTVKSFFFKYMSLNGIMKAIVTLKILLPKLILIVAQFSN